MKSDLKDAIQKVNERRKRVIQHMLAKKKTPTEIAAKLGISRQRYHQLLNEYGLREPQA